MTNELYSKLTCALLHDLHVCDRCKKCEGEDFINIRMNLVRELAEETGHELPWSEDEPK